MMIVLKIIYDNVIYTIFIVILALFSLFAPLSNTLDLYINLIFIVDLCLSSFIFFKYADIKTIKTYFRYHVFDIISCVPIQFLSIFKTFRLIRLVRISRLFKLSRTAKLNRKITVANLFKFDTFKELFIYLTIYLLANIYMFKEFENVSIIDAIYWVMATITTVGYGDITPTHAMTKLLACFLMVIGVATMGYINGAIISVVVTQNKK